MEYIVEWYCVDGLIEVSDSCCDLSGSGAAELDDCGCSEAGSAEAAP